MHSDKGSETTLDRASRSLPAFIASGLLGGLLVGVLVGNIAYAVAGGVLIAPVAWFVFAGRRAIRKAPDNDAGP